MRKIKRKKEKNKTEIEKRTDGISSKMWGDDLKSLKTVLILSWLAPFISVFLIYLSKAGLSEKIRKIVVKILNMNFTVILIQFFLISIMEPLALAKAPAAVIYTLMAMIFGAAVYWGVSHMIGTVKWLKGEDYSYRFTVNFFKVW